MTAPSATVQAVAVDYGGTISTDQIDPALGQKPVAPDAAAALHQLHQLARRLILASNTRAEESRWPALRAAGVAELFAAALLSAPLGVGKPQALFYRLVITAAQCPPEQILFVGDHLTNDVAAPLGHGMHAALVRTTGQLHHAERLPDGALLIRHIRELPALLH